MNKIAQVSKWQKLDLNPGHLNQQSSDLVVDIPHHNNGTVLKDKNHTNIFFHSGNIHSLSSW